jgi:microcystin-dependent protein
MSYRRSAITPSNFKIGNSIIMNQVIDNQPYLYPVKDLYIDNINIHLGSGAGYEGSVYQFQGTGAVAVGGFTAQNYQGQYAVAVGYEAAQQNQGTNSVAVGVDAAQIDQGDNSVAIGINAGQDTQGDNAISIGINAGQTNQSVNSVAIGVYAGQTNQEPNCIAIGNGAGFTNQGITAGPTAGYSIAIGNAAGYTNQGDFTIAIGSQAGFSTQADNSIILNAQANTSLDSSTEGLFVKPVRNIDYDINYEQVRYNPTSGEFTWSHAIPGIISMYGGVNSPTGYLFCNGQEVSRSEYSRLFSVIGSIYGNGDGVNTFNLPNLQGRVPVGLKSTEPVFNALGNIGGTGAHTLSVNEMPSHNHGVTDPGHIHSYFNQPDSHQVAVSLTTTGTADDVNENQSTGSSTTGITINNTGGGESHNNLQPYIVLNYIISF